MTLMTNLLFWALYLLVAPLRLWYFNSPAFLVVLAVCIAASSAVLTRMRAKGSRAWWPASIAGFLASLISYVTSVPLQNPDGMANLYQQSGAGMFVMNLLVVPAFSYAFVLLPVAVALASFVATLKKATQL